jgi:curved DNA-binding protein CbpA
MSTSHWVLGIDPSADAATIRKRYLELVRQHAPEKDPERFAQIKAAYDELSDPVTFAAQRLFELQPPHAWDAIVAEAVATEKRGRIGSDELLKLGATYALDI